MVRYGRSSANIKYHKSLAVSCGDGESLVWGEGRAVLLRYFFVDPPFFFNKWAGRDREGDELAICCGFVIERGHA